ncbi:nidogen-like domain-containing protein [Neptunicella sp. SCSIO 80796]|uniref:nidogen-like domain-containing protein n=1 Tax=Neptunicella plasticusilytica TaxID=3117012 RepID=UPI003A4E42F9
MRKLNSFVCGAVLSSLLATTSLSFSANASILLSWDHDNDISTADGFGDLAMNRNDDGSSSQIFFNDFANLAFDAGINFFGNQQDSFYINNNGNITFNGPVSTYTPDPFPVSNQPMIAPFWGDVDTGCEDCGEVFFGSPNQDTLVVTWNNVGFFNENSSKTNSFQLVLIDRADTGAGNFDVEFRYEKLEWTTGDASDGVGGLGGTPAQAGYDAGDRTNFYTLPGSRTANVLDLANTSNTGTNGIWTFAIRNGELPGDSPANPVLPIIDLAHPGEYEFEFVITEPETPIFIDPDVAIGYDYIVNSGPLFASVVLPTGFDDNLFDLWLWDSNLNDWFDTTIDITGGIEYFFTTAVDRFRILGIDIAEMVDPNNPLAFVTGLTFNTAGIINMNQNAITEFVDDGTSNQVPEPPTLLLMLAAAMCLLRIRKQTTSR